MGLAVDKIGNIYICYWKTSEISAWSTDFSLNRILLSGNQLQGTPMYIVYSNVTRELFISYRDGNKCMIDRFQVTCDDYV